MSAAWTLKVRPTLKLVLLALCDNASDEGSCYPLISTLVRKCGLSERAIQGAISELEAAGHVKRYLRHNRSTIYRVHPQVSPQDLHPPSPQQMRSDVHELHASPAAAAPRPAAATPITISYPSVESSPEREARQSVATTDPQLSKRCPADFVVTADMRAWASADRPGVDVDSETAKFRDHEFAQARSQWPAAWKNWMRRARPDPTHRPALSAETPTTEQRQKLRAWALDPRTIERWPDMDDRIIRAPPQLRWAGYHRDLQELVAEAGGSPR